MRMLLQIIHIESLSALIQMHVNTKKSIWSSPYFNEERLSLFQAISNRSDSTGDFSQGCLLKLVIFTKKFINSFTDK